MFRQSISSNMFYHDAGLVQQKILDSKTRDDVTDAERSFRNFQDHYEPMDAGEEEDYEAYWQTLTYLSTLLESRLNSFRG